MPREVLTMDQMAEGQPPQTQFFYFGTDGYSDEQNAGGARDRLPRMLHSL